MRADGIMDKLDGKEDPNMPARLRNLDPRSSCCLTSMHVTHAELPTSNPQPRQGSLSLQFDQSQAMMIELKPGGTGGQHVLPGKQIGERRTIEASSPRLHASLDAGAAHAHS
jgi:hypothetical protein